MNCAVGIPMEQPKTKKQVDKMVIICDFSKHPRYKKDKLERKQAAALRDKYIEKRRREIMGIYKMARGLVIRMLKDGTLSAEKIVLYADVTLDFVKRMQKELDENPNLSE